MQSGERITYLVHCEDDPTPQLDAYITALVGHLWYARMHKARIIVGDTYTNLLVVKAADRFGIPVQCVGTRRRPRNSVTPYCRIKDETEIVQRADACFFVGRNVKPLALEAQRLGKEVYTY